jgi:hypothetical protein
MSNQPRSVFQTKTAKSALVAALAGLITAIAPPIFEILNRHSTVDPRDLESIENLVLRFSGFFSIGGAFFSIIGRASATDKVYSPDIVPGFNKKDLEEVDPNLQ